MIREIWIHVSRGDSIKEAREGEGAVKRASVKICNGIEIEIGNPEILN